MAHVLIGVAVIAALMLAWLGREILLLLFAAIVLAAVVTAVVEWLGTRFRIGQQSSLALILGVACALVGLMVWISGPIIVAQFADLQTDLPQAARHLVARVNATSWGSWLLAQWSDYSQLSSSLSSALSRIGVFVQSTATMLAEFVVIAVLGLYLAAEPELYFAYVLRATPQPYRSRLIACAAAAVRNLRWWVLAQMLSMAAVGVIVAIVLWMLGVPLAGILGVIAALLTFIPNIGPILSVVPAVLLAVAITPAKGLFTVLLFLAVHFLEGNVITPLLERQIARLPPALTMTAQIFLAVIAGPLGLALAAPLSAAALGVFNVLVPGEANDPSGRPAEV